MNRYSYSDLQTFVATLYRGKSFIMRPFAYPVEFLTVTAGSTATQFLTIQANGDFTLTEIASVVTGAASFIPSSPLGYFQVTDTGSNEKWTNDLVPVMNYGGSGFGTDPYYLPFPRFLQGNTQLQIQYRNDAGVSVNLFLTFRGVLSRVLSQ